jgi:D-aspartate ligase
VTRETTPDERPTAVVVALDCITGLQTARILAARGIPVVGVVADRDHFCARTRVTRRIVTLPTAGEALIDGLVRLARTIGDRPVLIPCSDAAVLAISRWRERLEASGYRFVLPDHQVVEQLMDKVAFTEYAMRAGLPIPSSRILRSRDDAVAASVDLPYPAVLKPALKTATWSTATKAKAIRVEDGSALLAAWDRWSAAADNVMISQTWIEGDETALVSVNAYADRSGDIRVLFTARKLRQWPPETGTSSLGEEIRDDAVRATTVRLLEDVRYRGLAYLEMKRDARTGEALIVEPNVGRPTGRSAIAEKGGVELILSAYLDALGEPLPAATEQSYNGVKWIYWRHDLQAAAVAIAAGRLTPIGWWRSVRGPKWEAVWDPLDPRPFAADLLHAAGALATAAPRAMVGRARSILTGTTRHHDADA